MTEEFDSKALRIDPDNLDHECVLQPDILDFFGKRHSVSRDQVDNLEKGLKLLKAQLYKSIRQKADLDNTKITEGGVENEILTNSVFIDQQRRLRGAELTASKAWVDYQVAQKRGDSIDNLVKLHLSGYFGQLDRPGVRETRTQVIEKRLAEIMSQAETNLPVKQVGGTSD